MPPWHEIVPRTIVTLRVRRSPTTVSSLVDAVPHSRPSLCTVTIISSFSPVSFPRRISDGPLDRRQRRVASVHVPLRVCLQPGPIHPSIPPSVRPGLPVHIVVAIIPLLPYPAFSFIDDWDHRPILLLSGRNRRRAPPSALDTCCVIDHASFLLLHLDCR